MSDKRNTMLLQIISKFDRQCLKFIFLALILYTQSSVLSAQSTGKNIRVVTYDNLELFGKSLEDNPEEIILVLDMVGDTMTIDKSIIKIYYDLNDEHKIFTDNGGYHRKTGLVNSIGFQVGNFSQYAYAGEQLSVLFDYSLYKLIRPRVGLGVGVGYKSLITAGELGQENYPRFNFIEFNVYGKFYLNNSQRRLFVDTRIGYGIAGSDIRYYTYDAENRIRVFNYSSGYMLQPGIGLEFARNRRFRSGVKLSGFFNHTGRDGMRGTSFKYYKGVMIGFNFYY